MTNIVNINLMNSVSGQQNLFPMKKVTICQLRIPNKIELILILLARRNEIIAESFSARPLRSYFSAPKIIYSFFCLVVLTTNKPTNRLSRKRSAQS